MSKRITPILPNVEFMLAGKLMANINYAIEEIETRSGLNQVPEARIRIRAGEDAIHSLLNKTAPGVEASIILKLSEDTITLFSGEIIEQAIELDRTQTSLNLHLKHPLYHLSQTLHSQIFSDMTDLEIIKKIMSDHGIAVKQTGCMTLKHEQMVQYKCSDWSFVQYRLNANNTWLVAEDKQVSFIEAKISNQAIAPSHLLTREDNTTNPGIVSMKSFKRQARFSSDAVAGQWDIAQQKMSAEQRATKVKLGSGALETRALTTPKEHVAALYYGLPLEAAETAARINALEVADQLQGNQMMFTLWGRSNYHPGEALQIKGFGQSIDGTGVISEVRHYLTPNKWETQVLVGQEPQDLITALIPTISGIHIGIVAPHQEDKKNWYRLPIHLPTLGNSQSVLWARIALPYASNDGSMGFYPNPGDEIIVAFLEDDPRFPVVLGAVHNPKTPPPKEYEERVNKKYIIFEHDKTRQHMVFDIKDKSLALFNESQQITLDKDITLKSDKDINLDAKVNKITANDVKVNADSAITLVGKKIELKK